MSKFKFFLFTLIYSGLIMESCSTKERVPSERIEPYSETNAAGKVKSKGFVDMKTSRRVGYWEYFSDDGKIKAAGNYEDGFKIGEWKYSNPELILNWRVYTDSSLQVILNVPVTFRAYPNYKQSNVLAFSDTTEGPFHINFNISRYSFEKEVPSTDRIKSATGSDVLSFSKVVINGRDGFEYHTTVKGYESLYLSQMFVNTDTHIYLFNFFNNNTETALFNEIVYSLRIANDE